MKSKMRYCKVRGILLYHKPNKVFYPEEYADHLLLLFHPSRDEKELLSECPPLYLNILLEPGVKMAVNNNKIKFEPCSDLVDEAYSCYNANMLDNQDPFIQIENDETGEAVYSNDENTNSSRNPAIPNFKPRFIEDHQNLDSINYLNSKQYDVSTFS